MSNKQITAHEAATAVAAALAAVSGIVGCSGPVPGDPVSAYEESQSHAITEHQAQIARDLGCSEDDVERMLGGGADPTEYENILYTEAILDRLEQAYGIVLRAKGVHAPEWSDRSWWVTARVEGGEHEGTEVHGTWHWYDTATGDSLEEPYYTDDVIATLRGAELEEWLGSVAEDELGAYDVAWEAFVETTEARTPEAPLAPDAAPSELSTAVESLLYVYLPPWAELDRAAYDDALARLAARLSADAGGRSLATLSAYRIIAHVDGSVPTSVDFESLDTREAARSANAVDGQTYEWHVVGTVSDWGDA